MSLETDIISYYNQGKSQRNQFDNRWQRFLDLTGLPRKDITTEREPGATKTNEVVDGTTSDAHSTFTNFIHGNLFAQGTKWHSMRYQDPILNEIPEAAWWLFDAVNRMLNLYARTNFYSSTLEWVGDVGWAGNAEMLTEEVQSRKPVLQPIAYTTVPVGSFVWCEGNDGLIDTTYRCFPMTVQQIMSRWGDNPRAFVPDAIRKLADKEPFRNFRILHAIMPRDVVYNRRLKTDKQMPYASIWIDYDGKKLIQESGYHEYPCAPGRWAPISGEIYARGQGDLALPDTGSLNYAKSKALIYVDKTVDPPLVYERQSIPGGVIDYNAGGRTVVNNMQRRPELLAPSSGGNQRMVELSLVDMRDQIRNVFYYQPIKALISNESPQPEKTAFEVSARLKLLYQIIAPVAGRMMEGMKRMIDTTFAIMFRRGMFAPIPDVLVAYMETTKKKIITEVEFQGALARFQRQEENEQIMDISQKLLFLSQFDTNVLYKLDAMKAADSIFTVAGRNDLARDKKQVNLIIQKDEQIKQLQQQLMVANSVADTAGKIAPALTAIQGGKQAA